MLFGRARLLNGQSSTPNSNQGCRPALYGTGRLAALATQAPACPLRGFVCPFEALCPPVIGRCVATGIDKGSA